MIRMIMLPRNAVELSGGMEQADRRREFVREITLHSLFRGESVMALPFHGTGTGALPPWRIRTLSDFLNRFPNCFL